KTNGKMNEGGKLKTEYHQTWAEYYCRYIKEYADTGIPIWGISVQNEPAAKQTWDSCLYTAEEERDFIKNYLGPAIKKADLGDLKVVIWDHNRDLVYERAKVVLDDPKAAEYVWGTGFHWYCGDHFENIQKLHDEFPHKQLIFTEGCQEGGTHLGSWDLGERYARSIINDLNRWTVAWIDWNLILNEQGGPNHVGNYCSAPIIADTRTGELHYQSSYYYLGHFSRYMRPGSVRIQSQVSTTDLEALAAVNAHGETVVTILNSKNKTVNFNLTQANISHSVTSPPRSIITLITAP
ncbi:MAG: glycoside hydrolase family 30 protein, partial [FCB group bacterium]|nr:glycoside hydrolase family 30 protein [FCB group bacterium]